MTNTDTADITATANQIVQLAEAGSEIVRMTINNAESAKAVPRIRDLIADRGQPVPLVGDFHYNGHILLKQAPQAAAALAKYRVNPGNVGVGNRHDKNFLTMIDVAIEFDKPIRIGVNWGSLDQDLLKDLILGKLIDLIIEFVSDAIEVPVLPGIDPLVILVIDSIEGFILIIAGFQLDEARVDPLQSQLAAGVEQDATKFVDVELVDAKRERVSEPDGRHFERVDLSFDLELSVIFGVQMVSRDDLAFKASDFFNG